MKKKIDEEEENKIKKKKRKITMKIKKGKKQDF